MMYLHGVTVGDPGYAEVEGISVPADAHGIEAGLHGLIGDVQRQWDLIPGVGLIINLTRIYWDD